MRYHDRRSVAERRISRTAHLQPRDLLTAGHARGQLYNCTKVTNSGSGEGVRQRCDLRCVYCTRTDERFRVDS